MSALVIFARRAQKAGFVLVHEDENAIMLKEPTSRRLLELRRTYHVGIEWEQHAVRPTLKIGDKTPIGEIPHDRGWYRDLAAGVAASRTATEAALATSAANRRQEEYLRSPAPWKIGGHRD